MNEHWRDRFWKFVCQCIGHRFINEWYYTRWHRTCGRCNRIISESTQPAQAVDALQDAIFQIAERLGEVRDPGMDDMSWHTQLIARAQYLANAQAVDVGAIQWVIDYLEDEGNACIATGDKLDAQWGSRILSMSRKLARAISNKKE